MTTALDFPQEQIDRFIKAIKDDYALFYSKQLKSEDARTREYAEQQIAEFNVSFEPGSKFIRVVTDHGGNHRGSHSFIVGKTTDKWTKGTILKCAGWKTPAQNFARGHLSDEFHPRVRWTGAM
jgi:hypothetical protein